MSSGAIAQSSRRVPARSADYVAAQRRSLTPRRLRLLATALDAIDDPVALVDGRPVAVNSLWRAALRSVTAAAGPAAGHGHRAPVVVVVVACRRRHRGREDRWPMMCWRGRGRGC